LEDAAVGSVGEGNEGGVGVDVAVIEVVEEWLRLD